MEAVARGGGCREVSRVQRASERYSRRGQWRAS